MTILAEPGLFSTEALHHFSGHGLELHFQDGPIGQVGVNGCTNEEIIQVLVDRIESLNAMSGRKYACTENDVALIFLRGARQVLELRTQRRVARGVEGTDTP